MEIKHLRYLVAIVEELSFVTAAARLGLTEQGLRMGVARLERELGGTVVTRNPVTPTPLGRGAALRARRALRHYENLLNLGADKDEVSGADRL